MQRLARRKACCSIPVFCFSGPVDEPRVTSYTSQELCFDHDEQSYTPRVGHDLKRCSLPLDPTVLMEKSLLPKRVVLKVNASSCSIGLQSRGFVNPELMFGCAHYSTWVSLLVYVVVFGACRWDGVLNLHNFKYP